VRHRKAGKKLGRNTSHRQAMFRNMATSLFKHEQIETTDVKAKQLRPVAEKMITLAKRGDLHARRQVLAYMKDKAVTHRLFEELKDRYLDRQGGYVRIIKKGTRKGDAAPISVIQLLPEDQGKKKSKKKAAAEKSDTGKSKDKTPAKAKKAETAPSKEGKAEEKEAQ
jgi:large subunit ribosomal protein L17